MNRVLWPAKQWVNIDSLRDTTDASPLQDQQPSAAWHTHSPCGWKYSLHGGGHLDFVCVSSTSPVTKGKEAHLNTSGWKQFIINLYMLFTGLKSSLLV